MFVVYVYESFIAVLGRLPYYGDIILLAKSSETSLIVKAVRGFYSASPLHTINYSIIHTTRHSSHHADYIIRSSLEL